MIIMNLQKRFLIAGLLLLPATTPLYAQENINPTAEDILKALKQRRPFNEVIAPVGLTLQDIQKTKQIRKLLPEGWTLVDRTGRLEKKDDWWYFVFEPALGDLPIKLLHNSKLEQMVRTVVHADTKVVFSISGEMTVFKGENYLLTRMAMRPLETVNIIPDEPAAGSNQNQSAPQPEDIAIDATVEDVLSKMKNLKPTQSLVGFKEPQWPDESYKEATSGRPVLADGTPFIRRAGRLFERESWWEFAPESDHPDHPEPPMRLLPNKNTELMVRAWDRNNIGLVYIVSGEVTLFNGENYLLPKVAIRRIHSGNLRK